MVGMIEFYENRKCLALMGDCVDQKKGRTVFGYLWAAMTGALVVSCLMAAMLF